MTYFYLSLFYVYLLISRAAYDINKFKCVSDKVCNKVIKLSNCTLMYEHDFTLLVIVLITSTNIKRLCNNMHRCQGRRGDE